MALVIGKKQAANGIDSQWRDYKDKDGNVLASVLILGNGNKPYQQAIDRIARHGQKIDQILSGGLTAESLTITDNAGMSEMDAHCLIAAQYLIVNWRGVEDENGADVPYSADTANTVLQQNTDLFLWLIKQAKEIQLDENTQVEETVKKPLPAITGSPKAKAQKKPKPLAKA